MASLNHFANMYDVKLKPRLLRLLTDEYLPDGAVPVPTPPELSYVVHAIKNFGLLSESFPDLSESKLVEDWKSSVDVWFDRLLSLVSSESTVNCWVGTSLLGVTCLECSSNRFLASYPIWLDKLLSHIEPPSDSEFVKAASCASISDVLTRLGGYSNVTREGISHAGKFIQPVLNLLNEDSSEALLEGAVGLLCTIITFFPSSLHHDYETAEAAIVSKIMSRKYSVNMLKKYAHCLALLPKSRGDEDSWSLMMQKLLISINVNLTDAFAGLREEAAVKFLVPPGKDPSTSLANHSESSGQASQKSGRLLVEVLLSLGSC
ncbi:hypothetical protein F0562_004421 [Nyssa sinensis]|uniref:Pre-rRNA-processing protein RIX1 N-terminal domain-containing protein n=1 Tax=Nyssa sinensis TaxID=561372 RepID=A0A5J5C219_9ASTE|nr:hypothetical protein F0562_004421 [Nyssa sinensis]